MIFLVALWLLCTIGVLAFVLGIAIQEWIDRR